MSGVAPHDVALAVVVGVLFFVALHDQWNSSHES